MVSNTENIREFRVGKTIYFVYITSLIDPTHTDNK